MPKKGHSEEQIIAALKQYEGGAKAGEICRQWGIIEATFYAWANWGELGRSGQSRLPRRLQRGGESAAAGKRGAGVVL